MSTAPRKTGFVAIGLLGVLGALTSLTAVAEPTGAQIAEAKGCMACHALDKEVWGPSLRQVARYYRPLSTGQALMAQKILKGSAEHWGDRSMPAHATRPVSVSSAEAEQIAAWVLTLQ